MTWGDQLLRLAKDRGYKSLPGGFILTDANGSTIMVHIWDDKALCGGDEIYNAIWSPQEAAALIEFHSGAATFTDYVMLYEKIPAPGNLSELVDLFRRYTTYSVQLNSDSIWITNATETHMQRYLRMDHVDVWLLRRIVGETKWMARRVRNFDPLPTYYQRREPRVIMRAVPAPQPAAQPAPVAQPAPKPAPAQPKSAEDALCVVCLDLPQSFVAVPCGHVCLCGDCVRLMAKKPCPICRAPTTQWMQVYRS